MGVIIKHGSNQIANLLSSGLKTLKTGGKYVPSDITVDYTADSGSSGSAGWTAEVAAAKTRYDTLLSGIQTTYHIPAVEGIERLGNRAKDGYSLVVPDVANGSTVRNVRFYSEQINIPFIYGAQNPPQEAPEGTLISGVIAYYLNGKSNITFENCIFEKMGAAQMTGCNGVTFRNCYFKDSENGVYVSNTSNVLIENCVFEMNTTGLKQYYQGIYLADGNSEITATNCVFIAENMIHTPFRCGTTGTGAASSDVLFDHCKAFGKFQTCFQNIKSVTSGDGSLEITNCEWWLQAPVDSSTWLIIESSVNATSTLVNSCKIVSVDNVVRGGSHYYTRFVDVDFVGCGTEAQVKTNNQASVSYTNCTFTAEYTDSGAQESTGSMIRYEGQFTTSSTGNYVSVPCGFKPDVVAIKGPVQNYNGVNYEYDLAAVFAEATQPTYVQSPMTWGEDEGIVGVEMKATDNGFDIMAFAYSDSWAHSFMAKTFTFVALKFGDDYLGGKHE